MKGIRVHPPKLALTCALLLALFPFTPMWAQIDTGGVTGTVLDSTGAVEPGAQITLTNIATAVAQVVHSTSAGIFRLKQFHLALILCRPQLQDFKPMCSPEFRFTFNKS